MYTILGFKRDSAFEFPYIKRKDFRFWYLVTNYIPGYFFQEYEVKTYEMSDILIDRYTNTNR